MIFHKDLKRIQNTGKTLCYLAEASGLQLDYISKMNKGKRIPKEEDRLVRLLDAMECTAGTKSDLLLLYRQEKIGNKPVAMYGRTYPYHPAGCN